MGRNTNRNYKKNLPFRDATLFVIVCEGAKREKEYFQELAGDSKKVRVEIIPPEENKSSPEWLLNNAAKAVEESYQLGAEDQLWFVLDVDCWEPKHLHHIGGVCKTDEEKWFCAISNPCFEVWLFMHYADIEQSTAQTGGDFKRELNQIINGGYNKKTAIPLVLNAIQRSEIADKNPAHFMPVEKSTKVYQLAKALLEKQKRL